MTTKTLQQKAYKVRSENNHTFTIQLWQWPYNHHFNWLQIRYHNCIIPTKV